MWLVNSQRNNESGATTGLLNHTLVITMRSIWRTRQRWSAPRQKGRFGYQDKLYIQRDVFKLLFISSVSFHAFKTFCLQVLLQRSSHLTNVFRLIGNLTLTRLKDVSCCEIQWSAEFTAKEVKTVKRNKSACNPASSFVIVPILIKLFPTV